MIIADDQKLFAWSITMVIEKLSDGRFKVLATAGNGHELIDRIALYHPQLVLVDIRMPGMDGIAAIDEIRSRFPAVKILMLTTFDFDEYIETALEYGALGYVLKDCNPKELLEACAAVANGEQYFCQEVRRRMPRKSDAKSGYVKADIHSERLHSIMTVAPDFGRREAEVMDLLMKLYDNFEIGEKLAVSEQTVKNYTSTIYAKLGVKDRMHAIRLVRRRLEDLEAGLL